MSLDQLLVFLTLTLFLSASPGPVMLTCMANGGRYGVYQSLPGMAGATMGNLVLIVLSSFGISVLLKQSDMLFRIMQWVGAAYLIWLGLKTCLQPIHHEMNAHSRVQGSATTLLWQSFGIAVSNPKGLIYFGALFPQFLTSEKPLLPQLVVLTGLFISIDFAWMLIYTKSGSAIMKWLRSPQHKHLFQYCAGGVLIVAGILLAFTNF
jgi:threonine/homoserine/homoserine lactone efflux protein